MKMMKNLFISKVPETVKEKFISFYTDHPLSFELDVSFLPIMFGGILFYALTYKIFSPVLSGFFFKEYNELDVAQKKEWNTRVNSNINSVTVSTVCLYMLIYDGALRSNPLIYRSYLLKTNLSLLLGYMISDTWIMLRNYNLLGDCFFIMHHVLSVFAFAYVVTLDLLPYFSNLRLMSEFSTVFVNLRWFLTVLHYEKTSVIFIANGVIMTMVFFFCRILMIPLFWYKIYCIMDTKMWNELGYLKAIVYAVCTMLDLMNLYWFSKISRGCFKVLKYVHHQRLLDRNLAEADSKES